MQAVLLLFCLLVPACAYLPIFCFHGFSGSHRDFSNIEEWVNAAHPGTPVHSLALFEKVDSYKPVQEQIDGVIDAIRNISNANGYTEYHLMCHSQGGIVCRGVVEQMADHKVHTFISMAGVQAGQFGICCGIPDFIPGVERNEAYLLLYTKEMQAHFSAAGYWNDPLHHDKYLERCSLLPVLNNETYNPNMPDYKKNFLRLQQLALFGGPQDGVVQPWQTAFFSTYAVGSVKTIVPMEQQEVYVNDYFGLRTLDEDKRVAQHVVPNVHHTGWINDKAVFDKHVLPYCT